MTDPFVQRMMARSQARRAGLGRNVGSLSNKENIGVSAATRSRLKQINSLYSDDLKQAASPLQTSNMDSAESVKTGSSLPEKKDTSPNKITSAFVTDSGLDESPHKVFPASEVQGSTSPSKPHLSALARRCKEMKAWDDDHSYHPISHNSQEAQGFTPSESCSRLYYNFKKDHPQTSGPSLAKEAVPGQDESQPSASPSKEPIQGSSPSKVGEMRSRWEQHIRQSSPERADQSHSPRKSVSRSVSPRKIPYVQSSSNINQLTPKKTENPTSTHSPLKSSSHVRSQSPEKYQPYQGGFSRCGPERKSWRNLSPNKPPPVGEVVKGEAPVPDAVPLVDQPFMSSVRERAAAFNNAGGHEPEKDPAEMSVQERLALFNKKQGAALVPKAPFGQSVSAKTLHGDAVSGARDTSSKPSVAHSQPVQKPSKRMALEPSPAITQKLLQIQKGNKSASPERDEPSSFQSQRKLFENVKDNWRENEINSKIQTERHKEMDLLLNRFKKSKPCIAPQQPATTLKVPLTAEKARYPEESESEYLESDDESFVESESMASEETITHRDMLGPPKPPRVFLNSSSSTTLNGKLIQSPPPFPTHQKFSSQHHVSPFSTL